MTPDDPIGEGVSQTHLGFKILFFTSIILRLDFHKCHSLFLLGIMHIQPVADSHFVLWK